jgi:para-nitrobenzyl esterase
MKNEKPMRVLLFGLMVLAGATGAGARGAAETPLFEPSRWQGDSVVTTRYGSVQGYADADETWVWKAIPYARPPVGELRWRAPRDPASWTGVRRQRDFSQGCTQYMPVMGWVIDGSEDCLYLNVWRPRSEEIGLPVYVWIHGGGNSIGSAAFIPDYYGNALAHASTMVFVSINYRLGPFGWFANPALREGVSAVDDSGNFGTLDIIRALEWVRDNIAAFGGDPGAVMVAGESAGAMNILSLIISPPARGLFTRALMESGAPTSRDMRDAEAQSDAVLRQLLFKDGKARGPAEAGAVIATMSRAAIRTYLRSKTDREILRCYNGGPMGMIDNPAILRDGYVIPKDGYKTLDSGDYPNKVPIIIGSNAEELKLFLAFDFSLDWKSGVYQAIAKYASDTWKANGVDGVARSLSSHPDQPPVYAYRFLWGAPDAKGKSPLPGEWGPRLGAFHNLDVPFFLGTDTIDGPLTWLLFTKENNAGRKALSAAMMGYIAGFIRTGEPNRPGSGLPEWRPWSNEADGPKSIGFNVNGDAPAIEMGTSEVTEAGIAESMKNELPADVYEKTRQYLSRSMRFTSER